MTFLLFCILNPNFGFEIIHLFPSDSYFRYLSHGQLREKRSLIWVHLENYVLIIG